MEKLDCRKAFADELLELARKDQDIMLVATDSRGSAVVGEIAQALPEQFLEMGIAEQDAVGAAAGLALTGKNVFVCGPACFLAMRSAEQVRIDVAYSHTNVKIVGVSAGVSYGSLGSTHHTTQDFAVMRTLPGMLVLCPSDGRQAAAMARYLAGYEGPAYLRMGRGPVPVIYDTVERSFTPGKINVLREGKDIALIATGERVYYVLEAAKELARRGVEAAVLDVSTIKPFDVETVLRYTHNCPAMTIEEHHPFGGLGDATACVLGPLGRRLHRLSLGDEWAVCGSAGEIAAHRGMDVKGIVSSALELTRG